MVMYLSSSPPSLCCLVALVLEVGHCCSLRRSAASSQPSSFSLVSCAAPLWLKVGRLVGVQRNVDATERTQGCEASRGGGGDARFTCVRVRACMRASDVPSEDEASLRTKVASRLELVAQGEPTRSDPLCAMQLRAKNQCSVFRVLTFQNCNWAGAVTDRHVYY